MQNDPTTVRRAITARTAAARRIRGATASAVGVAAALTAVFTGLAAGSTHARRTSPRPRPRPATDRTRREVVAPAPPLVAIHSAAQPRPAQPAPPPTPPAPAPSAPAVVATGGS